MSDIRWSRYTLPNDMEIYLTQRPDRADHESVTEFITEVEPAVRFCFTDDPVDYQMYSPFCHWYPWPVNKVIPLESVYAVISLLLKYTDDDSTERLGLNTIWMHCDSSSMRAPTFLGLFLHAIYPDEIESICDKMDVSRGGDLAYAKNSCAMTYSQISMARDPGVKGLIEAWKQSPETAHEYYHDYDDGSTC